MWKDLIRRRFDLPAYIGSACEPHDTTCLMAMVSASSWCSCGSQKLGESVWSPVLSKCHCQPLIFSPEMFFKTWGFWPQAFPWCYSAQVHVTCMVLSAHATGACSLQLVIIGSQSLTAHISWGFLSTTFGSPGTPSRYPAVALVSWLFFGFGILDAYRHIACHSPVPSECLEYK